jgi:hypothetical protein
MVLDKLRAEAEQKQIPLNMLLNQIVKAHLEWHANAVNTGFMPIRKELVRWLFEGLTREQIDALATTVSHGLTGEAMMIMTTKHTEDSVLALMERWLRACDFRHHYEINEDDDERVFVIQHNLGMNWSYYLSRLFEEAVLEFRVKPETKVTENVVYIRIECKTRKM